MTQIRPYIPGPHGYDESMKRAVHVQDADDVVAYIQCHYPQWKPDKKFMVQIHCGADNRPNGWSHTWLIKLRNAPALWSDGPVVGLATFDLVPSE